MRICMLVRNRFARDARVLREARSLVAAGHEVTVLALRAPGMAADERRDGIRVLRGVDPGPLAGPTIRSDGEAAPPAAGSAGSFVRRLAPRPPALVWARDRMLTSRFARAACAVEADAYHAHDLNTLEAATIAARARDAKLVYDAHELYPDLTGLGRGERARWARAERRLIGRADAVIAPSESRAAEMARRYNVAMPLVVMNCPPAGPAPDPAASPLADLRSGDELVVVYAGGFTPNRGLDALIGAVGQVDGCRLVMVGWGPLEDALHAAAAHPAVAGRVSFHPPVPPDEVVPLVAGADAGVVSYIPAGRNNELAAPNKIWEYLHAGLAIAGSDLPDIRRVVEEHRVGVLFDARDVSSIVAALRALAADREALAAMRERAAAAAPAYTWQAQARVLVALYEHLDGDSAGPGPC